jgi:hypothetical protein
MKPNIQEKQRVLIAGGGTAGLIAALMIREKYPELYVSVVKSDKIGIVGVGEGSTEHWASFMRFIGIPFEDLIVKTKATIKIGILFKDWNLGKRYAHSLGSFESQLNALGYPEIFNHLYTNDEHFADKEFRLAPEFEVLYSRNRIPFGSDIPSNQFHFDTFKLNEYLVELCQLRDIDITNAEITAIRTDPKNGNISNISTTEGAMQANFYIDCTGFKRLFSPVMDNKWKSLVEYLPMNRAIAFPTQLKNSNFEPYTTATALSSGWSWRIPTQERYGNGYVFNSNYITPEKALEEIEAHLGEKDLSVGRDIPFEAGKVENFWVRNVLFLGLSGSFAEPLEAQSIGFTIVQMFRFLDYFDFYLDGNQQAIKRYNEELNDGFQNVVDYLQAHYFTKRDDSEFWKEKPFKLTDFNEEYMPMFKQGRILPAMFKPIHMFKVPNWYQVLGGLGVISKISVLNKFNEQRGQYYEASQRQTIQGFKDIFRKKFVTHEQYLQTVIQNYNDQIYFERI